MDLQLTALRPERTTEDRLPERDAFPMFVRAARATLNMNQCELAHALGMTQRSIHRIEQGHCEPRRATMLAMMNVFSRAGIGYAKRSEGGFRLVVLPRALEKAPSLQPAAH